MAGVFALKFTIEGETQVSRAFQLGEEAVGDLRPAFEVIGAQLRKGVVGQMSSQGGRGGDPWQPLSPGYKAWKDVHYPGRPTLVRTGDMRAALLSPQAVHASAQRLIFEPDTDVAAYHQKGDGTLPQRRVLQLTGADRRGWERTILTWIRHRQGRASWPPPVLA